MATLSVFLRLIMPAASWSGLRCGIGACLRSALPELKTYEPLVGYIGACGREFPITRGLQCEFREISAWAWRNKSCARNIAGRIHYNPDFYSNCAVDGVSRAAR